MLVFLFYIILALIIFIPTVLWASQFFKFSSRAMESYTKLVNTIETVDVMESMPLYMDDKTAIIGFAAHSDNFLVKKRDAQGNEITTIKFKKPVHLLGCPYDSACVCLCRGGLEYKSGSLSDLTSEISCKDEDKMICNSFDKINFLKIRPPTDFDAPQPYPGLWKYTYWWEDGFIISRWPEDKGWPVSPYFGGYGDQIGKGVRSIYVQRYQDYVNVCFSNSDKCITPGIKDEIHKEKAIPEFNRFTDFYKECKEKNNKECGEFHLNLPISYYIYYHNKASEEPSGFYLVKTYTPENWNQDTEMVKKDNKQIFTSGIIYNKNMEEYGDGNLLLAYDLKLKNDGGHIILEITTEFMGYGEI